MGSERIMTPDNRLWPIFLAQLSRVPMCLGTTKYARAVLAELPGIDVQASLDALADLGGTCDCQIELDISPIRISAQG